MRWFVAVLLVVAAFGAVRAWLRFETTDVVVGDLPLVVEVGQGEGIRALVRRLVSSDVLVADARWEPWLRVRRAGGCLQSGLHTLNGSMTPRAVVEALCEPGRVGSVRVTVPEGWNLFQIADSLDRAGIVRADAFLAAARSPALRAELGVGAESVEGRLFPDTYDVAEGMPAEEVIRTMHRRFEEVWTEVRAAEGSGAQDAGGDPAPDEATLVTLASLVEREAVVDEERARIARVFLNRIRVGMRLQSDPTCVYGPDLYRLDPSPSLCRDPESRYSTYVIEGLPPTPIANPGRASLEATVEAVGRPDEDAELLYFCAMADGSGRHAFARTLEEHNRNVRRYLRR